MTVCTPPRTTSVDARLARASTRGPVLVAVLAILVLGAARALAPGTLAAVGPVILLVGLLLGLPHGATDVARLTPGAPLPRQGAVGAVYLTTTVVVLVLWWWQPLAVLLVLLVVTVVHFGQTDLAAVRWAHAAPSSSARGWSTAASMMARGATPVIVPFALWPAQTQPLLDLLTSGHAAAVATAATWALPVLLVALVTEADLEITVLVALFVLLPPLPAFGVYFAAWHAWRQTLHQLAQDAAGQEHPTLQSLLKAFARRAVVPTAVALLGLGTLVTVWGTGIPAGYLVLLLAITVPHALVSARLDPTSPGLTSMPAPSPGGAGRMRHGQCRRFAP